MLSKGDLTNVKLDAERRKWAATCQKLSKRRQKEWERSQNGAKACQKGAKMWKKGTQNRFGVRLGAPLATKVGFVTFSDFFWCHFDRKKTLSPYPTQSLKRSNAKSSARANLFCKVPSSFGWGSGRVDHKVWTGWWASSGPPVYTFLNSGVWSQSVDRWASR